MRIALFLVMAVAVMGGGLLIQSSAPAQTPAFVETFDGAPIEPQPFSSPHWDIQVHERAMVGGGDQLDVGEMPLMTNAQHGTDCAPPNAVHTVATTADTVYRCRDHVMTAMKGSSYGAAMLTPDHMVDFSDGPAVIEFSVSTLLMSQRDWIDVWVTPWDQNIAIPITVAPDLQGQPMTYLRLGMDNLAPKLELKRLWEEDNEDFPSASKLNDGIASTVNQGATRQAFRLTVTPTSAKFERLASETAPYKFYWERSFANIGFTTGIVQWGHHSYNPTKATPPINEPGTWHWDSFKIEPAIPFTIGQVDQRYVYSKYNGAPPAAQTITFDEAPEGAMLRFTSAGRPVVNGDLVPYQPSTHTDPSKARSYFVPIPEGSTSATIQLVTDGWWECWRACLAKDFAIWSLDEELEPPPTPPVSLTPSHTPGPTETPSATTPVPDTQYSLVYSTSSNRSNPVDLDGATVNGNIYAFTTPATGVTRVRYFIDNPSATGTPYRTENSAPHDLGGGSATVADPFNTGSLTNGSHTITAAVDRTSGTTQLVHAIIFKGTPPTAEPTAPPPTDTPVPTATPTETPTPTSTPTPEPTATPTPTPTPVCYEAYWQDGEIKQSATPRACG